MDISEIYRHAYTTEDEMALKSCSFAGYEMHKARCGRQAAQGFVNLSMKVGKLRTAFCKRDFMDRAARSLRIENPEMDAPK